jgi:shikimate kinase
MQHLSETCIVVYLAIDLNVLKTRLSDVITRGVAIAPGKSIDDLYLERVPLYEKYADLTVQCKEKFPEQVVEAILRSLPGYRS